MKKNLLILLFLISTGILGSQIPSESVNYSLRNKGLKLITIGDSLTDNCLWQPYLCEWFGFVWSKEETIKGLHGGARTAMGGTCISPKKKNSIYIRALDAVKYKPDVIIIYGGQNDPLMWWKSNDNTQQGAENIVAAEKSYLGAKVNDSISVISAYKGMIENLLRTCPKTKIYLVTQMRVRADVGMKGRKVSYSDRYNGIVRFPTFEDVVLWEKQERYPKVEYIRAIGKHYGLPVIDLWDNSGITSYNAQEWYGKPAYDCTQVHPNELGYKRMAECIAKSL